MSDDYDIDAEDHSMDRPHTCSGCGEVPIGGNGDPCQFPGCKAESCSACSHLWRHCRYCDEWMCEPHWDRPKAAAFAEYQQADQILNDLGDESGYEDPPPLCLTCLSKDWAARPVCRACGVGPVSWIEWTDSNDGEFLHCVGWLCSCCGAVEDETELAGPAAIIAAARKRGLTDGL